MFKLLTLAVLALTVFAVPVAASLDGSFVVLEYFRVNDDGTESVFGTSEWDCGSAHYMYGTYYESTENGIGITGGTYAGYDDVCFEMPHYFALTEHEGRILLRGVIKAYDLSNSHITDGERKTIYHDIEYNRPVTFRFERSKKEHAVGIHLTLVDSKPEPVVADGPISLRTIFLSANDVFGYNTNSRGAINSRTNFQTSAGKARSDGGVEKAMILTEIMLPGYPENLTQPFKTELLFTRTYKIDTSYVSDLEFTSDITYRSEYKKRVELVPGKTLLLVFPADTPSVRGFDREDTLIIKP